MGSIKLLEREKEIQKRMDENLSIIDRINKSSVALCKKLLGQKLIINETITWFIFLFVIGNILYVATAIIVGEAHLIGDNIITGQIWLVGLLAIIWSETWIGDKIRKTAMSIYKTYNLDYNDIDAAIFKPIFNNTRNYAGILLGTGMMILFWSIPEPFNHSSVVVIVAGMIITWIVGFVYGEAGIGTLFTLRVQYKLSKELAQEMDLLNREQHKALREISAWGINVALCLSISTVIIYVGSFFGSSWVQTPIKLTVPIFNYDLLELPFMLLITIGVVLNIIIAVSLFTLPYFGVPKIINEKKIEHINEIDDLYTTTYKQMKHNQGNMITDENNTMIDPSASLMSFDSMRKYVNNISVQPYDFITIIKFIQAIIIPLILFIYKNHESILN
jgi:hypothetical protein